VDLYSTYCLRKTSNVSQFLAPHRIRGWLTHRTIRLSDQGVYKFNQANFEISRRDFKKNPGHVCLASASFGEIPILWAFQLSVSPPQPNRNLGEHHKLPTGVWGRAPAENGFWCIWNLIEHIWWR